MSYSRYKYEDVPRKGDHILFVGFMGCGKTTISRRLSKLTGMRLIDTDSYIVQTQGRSINQIFEEDGEAAFRRIETQTLAALAFEEKALISCGGGVCNSVINRAILRALGTVVYLKVPLEEAIGRISDPSTRPLLHGPRPVEELYEERLPLYGATADIVFDTSGRTVNSNVYGLKRKLEGKRLL